MKMLKNGKTSKPKQHRPTTNTFFYHCWDLELENHLLPFCGQLYSPASPLSLQAPQPLALMNRAVQSVMLWVSLLWEPLRTGGAHRHGYTPSVPETQPLLRNSTVTWEHHAQGGKKRLYWSLLTNTGLPGRRIASIVMETASALTVVPPWEVNTAWMVVTLNDPLCTLINICLREKHKPARKLISFDTNTAGLFFSKILLVWSFFKDFL